MKKKRAFLKWAGGKYLLLDDIRKHLPDGDCLVEPFVGAGSVFLNIDFPSYHLSDINNDLINLYNIVKTRSPDYIADAKRFFSARDNSADAYYVHRQCFNRTQDCYLRSLLFLYLNRHGYNGLCRYNLRGEFNVPFGRYKKPYFPEAELHWFAQRAQTATFTCQPYQASMRNCRASTVIYSDPPYAPLSATANFTAYHTSSFSLEQQQQLALIAIELATTQGVPVLISNHDTPLIRLWYQQAQLFQVRTRRSISRRGNGRIKIDELLALFTASQ